MFDKVDDEGLKPTARANSRHMNLRRRKGADIIPVSSNHWPFFC
jgi:hypothetical protein